MTNRSGNFKERRNKGGRPKGSLNRKTILKKIANHRHRIKEDGRWVKRTTIELVLMRLRDIALTENSPRIWGEFHRLLKKYGEPDLDENIGVLVAPAPISVEDWIRRSEEENKYRKPPKGYRKDRDEEY